jgi:hypothetical protein
MGDASTAVHVVEYWIHQVGWHGIGVDTSHLVVTGHSNGGK